MAGRRPVREDGWQGICRGESHRSQECGDRGYPACAAKRQRQRRVLVDFYILKPIHLSRGAHRVMYEPPNRGNKTWGTLGRFPGGNDPGSVTNPTVLGNAFFMPRGKRPKV